MDDPRRTPEQGRITEDTPASVNVPIADLNRSPRGPRDRQLLYGDTVTILARETDSVLVRAAKDGYCGWLPQEACGPAQTASHRVTVRATHAYAAPDIKSPDRVALSFGSQLTALAETATFVECALGFVPRQHVHTVGTLADDPAAVAELFLGTPYLWGGNSSAGIDCSGLIQAACIACGIPCPGDSDQQEFELGAPLSASESLRRNDVIFWRGHVALVTDADTILHANAGYMATVFEPISDAIARIETQDGGMPTTYKRFL